MSELTDTEVIWETFDDLFKTVHRQGRRVEELERRVVELERRLQERAAAAVATVGQSRSCESLSDMPAEKAA